MTKRNFINFAIVQVVKKFLTYLLLSVYLLSFPEARQVLKLPNLVEHYISHTLRDQRTSLYSFCKMHYLDAPVKDADYSQDMKLPFKTHDFSVASVVITVPPKAVELSFPRSMVTSYMRQHFTYSENFYPSVFQKIWQPPKI